MSSVRKVELELKNWRPGIARMTSAIDGNEKVYWLLQTRLTPYNASKAGVKYDPRSWSGNPLIRVIWVNRDGHLAEFQEWLKTGEEVQVPSLWELTVDEAIDIADAHSHVGVDTAWLEEAQATSTLIEDAVNWEFQKAEMAMNRSTFGPHQTIQRNGFPQELRRQKFRESGKVWK